MKTYALAPCFSLAVVVAGCHGSLLYEASSADNGGVPFYTVEQWQTDTASYDETYFQLRAVGTFESKGAVQQAGKKAEVTQTLVAYMDDASDVAAIYGGYLAASDYDKAWNATYKLLAQLLRDPASPQIPQPGGAAKAPKGRVSALPFSGVATPEEVAKLALIASSTARVQLPSTTVRYLNIHVPYGGSANGEVDVNENGTLSKGIAQKQDQLPAAAATAIGTVAAAALTGPGAALVSGLLPASTSSPTPAQATSLAGSNLVNVEFTVSVQHRIYTVTLSHRAGEASACDSWSAKGALFKSTQNCLVSLSVALKSDSGPSEKAKDNKDVTFSGSVQLPAPAASSKPGR
jgi:hypothetical protein